MRIHCSKKDYDSNDPPLNTTQPGYNPWRWPGKGPVEAAGDGYATAGLPVIKAVCDPSVDSIRRFDPRMFPPIASAVG